MSFSVRWFSARLEFNLLWVTRIFYSTIFHLLEHPPSYLVVSAVSAQVFSPNKYAPNGDRHSFFIGVRNALKHQFLQVPVVFGTWLPQKNDDWSSCSCANCNLNQSYEHCKKTSVRPQCCFVALINTIMARSNPDSNTQYLWRIPLL